MSTVRVLPREPDSRPHRSPPMSDTTTCGNPRSDGKTAKELPLRERIRRGKAIVAFAIRDVCTASAGGRVLRNALNNLKDLGFSLSPAEEDRLIKIAQRAGRAGMTEQKEIADSARQVADEIIKGVLGRMRIPASA